MVITGILFYSSDNCIAYSSTLEPQINLLICADATQYVFFFITFDI